MWDSVPVRTAILQTQKAKSLETFLQDAGSGMSPTSRNMSKRGKPGSSPAYVAERLDPEQIRMERIMLGLRTASGVPQTYLRRQCDGRVLDEALCRGNLVTLKDGLVRIPEERFFISDSIISFII